MDNPTIDPEVAPGKVTDEENVDSPEEINPEVEAANEDEEKTTEVEENEEENVEAQEEENAEKENEVDESQNSEEVKDTDEDVKAELEDKGVDDKHEEEIVVNEDNVEAEEIPDAEEVHVYTDAHNADDDAEETPENETEDVGDENPESQDGINDHQEDKPELTDEDRARYRSIFDRKAVQGRLDLKGFKVLFRLLGEVLSSDEAEEMFEVGDKNDDNTIDFDEFCRLYSTFRQDEQERKEAIMSSIDKLFPGSNGESVELKKVEQLLLKLQQPDLDVRFVREKSDLGEVDIRQLVWSMDVDGSGRISKQEFVDTLCQHIEI